MIDIYSRMIVGVHVRHDESALPAVEMMNKIFRIHGNPQVAPADRGPSGICVRRQASSMSGRGRHCDAERVITSTSNQ